MSEEIWKDLPKNLKLFRYQVSNHGKIRNKKSGYILRRKPRISGYIEVSLTLDSGIQSYKLHRLIAMTFLPIIGGKEEVDHINRDRSDNRVCNLRWANRKEQMVNSEKVGRKKGVPVLQYTLDQTFVKRWKNIKEAEDNLGIPRGKIGMVCRGKRKSSGGYKWAYDRIEILPGEEWKDYKLLEVSNVGRIRTKFGFITYGYKQNGGYLIYHKGGPSELVHVMVAKVFIPNPKGYPIVNHKDGNRKNNRVDNLEWTTQSDNAKHAHKKGLIKRSHNLNIPIEQYDLKGNHIKTFESMGQASRELGFNHGAISKVCNGVFKQTHGYVFKFVGKAPIKRSYIEPVKIDHIDKTGKLIKTYLSPMDAAKEFGSYPSNIHLVCKGVYKTTGKQRFRYHIEKGSES